MSEPVFLDLAQVLALHRFQVTRYGGDDGIRDHHLLESAIAQPQAAFGGKLLHCDLCEQAAAYLFHLCSNHPFVDGNKRVALHAALVFLELNGQPFRGDAAALYAFVMEIAQGKRTKEDITAFLRQ
jgi:death-on-curing protein